MDEVRIINQKRDGSGWTFMLDLTSSDFADDTMTVSVRLDDDTMQTLVEDADIYPDDLISAIFEAILEKQPKESLANTIDVDTLLRHLPWLKTKITEAIETGSLLP